MINRDLLYYDSFETFNTLKLSANQYNTRYTIGVSGAVQEGEPLVAWKTAVFIDDTRQIWIRGKLWDVAKYNAYGIQYSLEKSVGDAIDDLINSFDGKQDKLVSGENIKTINGYSLVGEGDISIKLGSPPTFDIDLEDGCVYIENGEGMNVEFEIGDDGNLSFEYIND